MPNRTVLSNQTWPFFHPLVFRTKDGTRYLKEPGAILVAQTETNLDHTDQFLRDFGFESYLDDPINLSSAEALSKFAGQLCYLAVGDKRTKNVDASKYFENIKKQAHGSVLEHASASVLLYGISRSLTHELVRHRAGTGFSQLSQRYVDGDAVRFVERPEYQNEEIAHNRFLSRIDYLAKEYAWNAEHLFARQAQGDTQLSGERKTDLRKAVNQAAHGFHWQRSCLETHLRDASIRTC
jgi:thymidylate synthase (FAD)